jgi:hypothetical protein
MKKKLKLDDVDVVFQPTRLTKEEKKLISEYIRQDKSKRTKKSSTHKTRRRIAA